MRSSALPTRWAARRWARRSARCSPPTRRPWPPRAPTSSGSCARPTRRRSARPSRSRWGSTTAEDEPSGPSRAQARARPADCRGSVQRVVLPLFAVLAMAASVLYASHAQRVTAELHARETAVANGLLSDMNRSDGALSAYAVTGHDEAFEDFRAGTTRVRRALATAATAADDDPQES